MPTQRSDDTGSTGKNARRPAKLPEHLEPGGGLVTGDTELDETLITGSPPNPEDERVVTDVGLTASRWSGGRLTGRRFRRLRCVDVVFADCDLSGVVLEDSGLRRVEFRECRMSGTVLAGTRMEDVLFLRCKLDTANLRMTAGDRLEFLDSELGRADFREATLKRTGIHDSDLSGADFSGADSRGLRLHGSRLHDIKGADDLRGATIGPDQLVDVSTALFAASGIAVEDQR
ncbi:pentapeptide repeat-containing protein [Actinopolyspora halophila]|uniref:pentapeptide repeat-containing protein n=1 Tax=Actinopolyspora halophila TaxID=1850 RepID=UPI00037E3B36|nr:pentapeptide repeat-containing protein [Actinopolyspora halophila]